MQSLVSTGKADYCHETSQQARICETLTVAYKVLTTSTNQEIQILLFRASN